MSPFKGRVVQMMSLTSNGFYYNLASTGAQSKLIFFILFVAADTNR